MYSRVYMDLEHYAYFLLHTLLYSPSLLRFLKFIFNWRVIALQCCVGSCHTTTQISRNYIFYSFPLEAPPPIPLLQFVTAAGWAPCVNQRLPTSCLFYTWQCSPSILKNQSPHPIDPSFKDISSTHPLHFVSSAAFITHSWIIIKSLFIGLSDFSF